MKSLLLIPTYNEINNIEKLIGEIFALKLNLDILIIDDNSPDGTGNIADKLSKLHNNLFMLHRTQKQGLGKAYMQGFEYALENKYDNVITMDADFSHNPQYLPEFLKQLNNFDLIIGSRYIPGGAITGWPFKRLFLSKFGNLYTRIVTGTTVKDNTTGYTAFHTNLLTNVMYNQISSEGYGFFIEFKYRAFIAKSKILEIPIIFTDRIAGISKISKNIIFEALLLVWKLRFQRNTFIKYARK